MARFGFRDPLHHDPEEAAAIRAAVADLLAGTRTMQQIAADWTREDLRRPWAPTQPWTRAAVQQALLGDRVGGIVRRDGKIVDEPPTWLPIITASQRQGLTAVMGSSTMRVVKGFNGLHLGRGIARCAICGAGLVPAGKGVRRQYACSTRIENGGSKEQPHPCIAPHFVDDKIRAAAVDLLYRYEGKFLDYHPRSLTDLHKLIGAAKARVEALVDDFEADAPLRRSQAANEVAVLEAERDDRYFQDALLRFDYTDLDTAVQCWDEAPLRDRWLIARHLLTVEVALGRGPGRVRVTNLVDG